MVFGWQSGNAIEPIFENDFAEHSYGFRPGRGCKDALREVDRLLEDGYVHVVDADLKGYFAERGLYSLVTAHASVVNPP